MTGQTGTGKELVARALHQLGPRRAKKLLTEAAEERLIRWSWPGNVRELRNAIERSCLLCEGHLLTEGDLARSLTDRRIAVGPVVDEEPPGPPPTADEVHAAMDSTGGNKSLAARRLGVSRRSLYRLIDKYAPAPQTS